MQLENRVAIVTGAGRGIGKAIAIALAKEGCSVAICARTKHELEQAKKEAENLGVKCIAAVCDVSKSDQVKAFVERVKEKLGRVDFLVNNAGIAFYKQLIETNEKEWDDTIDINLKGIYLMTKEVLPVMKKQRSGVIVNISSGAGKVGFAGLAAYCASKFGVIGLTESIADEVADDIKVVAVCPGGVDTKMYQDISGGARASLKPEHIAAKVLDVCLNPSKYGDGESIEVYHPFPLVSSAAAKLLSKNKGLVRKIRKKMRE